MFKRITCFLCSLLIILTVFVGLPATVMAEEQPFLMGVCAHPGGMTYVKYFDDIPYYIKKMGGNVVRIDLTGISSSTWDPFFARCKAYGLEIMGIVYNETEAQFFAERYGHEIKYMQMLNEQDLPSLISGSGEDKGAYNMNEIARIVSNMKKISAIMRTYSPKTQLVINYTYLHHGFMEHMVEQEVDFDVVGFDWYSNMDVYGLENTLDTIRDRFGKPIFICEANIWTNGQNAEQQAVTQANMGKQIIKYYEIFKARQKSHNILGFTIYELYEEPWKADGEAVFGIIKMHPTDNTLVGMKSAYYEVQEHLGYKNNNIQRIPDSKLDLSYKSPERTPQKSDDTDYEDDSQTQTVPGDTIVDVVTRNEEIVNTIYEDPETIQTVKEKHIFRTPGFPIWLVIEIAACVLVIAGAVVLTIVLVKKKKKKTAAQQ